MERKKVFGGDKMNWKKFVSENENVPLPHSLNARVSRELAGLRYGKNKSKTLAGLVGG